MHVTSPKILIVGGVAGGASAATRARRMNEQAEIIMFEKDEHVSFANCGLPYHIGEEIVDRRKLLVATPEFLHKRFRIDVRIRQEVKSIDRDRKVVTVHCHVQDKSYEESYDKLILAPGANPLVPPIEGVDAPNVLTLRNIADMDRIKTHVDQNLSGRAVMVGAGFIGLEMVEQLVRRGVKTALAELQPQVLPLLDPEMAQPLADELRKKGVELYLGNGIARVITDDSGTATAVELADGTQVEADLVIMGLGIRPNISLAQEAGLTIGQSGGVATNHHQLTDDPDIYAVGDAAEYHYQPTDSPLRIALAGPANRAGRLAGEHAATGDSATMAPVLGTSIVRVFDMTAGMTGLTVGLAGRLKRDVKSVTIVSNDHAGYFPGAQPLTLKLIYDPADGKMLGAQVIGREGVDKRIDVIATAMAFGATVRDLAGLDLAYAPPFGAAKDPIHLAAFAACNELDGLESFSDASADLSGLQVVDVRTTAEVEKAPLAGVENFVHIPVDELRERISELDPSQQTVVSCAVGVRGHIAARLLRQHGFDVSNLSGGATLRRRAVDAANESS